ncbi:MAG: hypothetical protein OXC30_00015 [Alphaproteobacteria bacterium]|nr:hypothetical protein [Alphaproteobacteria bacterium]
MTFLLLFLTFFYAHGSDRLACAAEADQDSITFSELSKEDKKLSCFVKEVEQLKKKLLSLPKVSKMVEAHFLSVASSQTKQFYCDTLKEFVTRSPDPMPKDFSRLVLSLHYWACPNERVDLTEEQLQNLLKTSQRELVFLMTQDGLFQIKDFLTLMLWDKNKYLCSFPENLSAPMSAHNLYEGVPSCLLLHDMSGHHSITQDPIVKGYYAKYFDIIIKILRPLWNDILGVKKTNKGHYRSVTNFLYWILHEAVHRYNSECKATFVADPLKTLQLKISTPFYVNDDTVDFLIGEEFFKHAISKDYDSYLQERGRVREEAAKRLRYCEELPCIKAVLSDMEISMKAQFRQEHGVVAPLDFVTFPNQKEYMEQYATKSEVLKIMIDGYNERRELNQGYPSAQTLEQGCALLVQDEEGREQSLNMRLVVFAKILDDLNRQSSPDSWSDASLQETLKAIRDECQLDRISEKQMFRLYHSDRGLKPGCVCNYEDAVVSAMTGIPLMDFDYCLKNSLNTVDLVTFADFFEKQEEHIIVVREMVREFVEEALGCATDSAHRAITFNICFCALCVKSVERPPASGEETIVSRLSILKDSIASNNYLAFLCESTRVVSDKRAKGEILREPVSPMYDKSFFAIQEKILKYFNCDDMSQSVWSFCPSRVLWINHYAQQIFQLR